MSRFVFLLPFFLITISASAQDSLKVHRATRVNASPKIDGDLSDEVWQQATPITDYFQFQPVEGSVPDQKTSVRIIYDNSAIYIGCIMYDTAPDSILKEMGARDEEDINADYMRIGFDPYNKRQDAYFFGIYASGVQFDNKVSDESFDAVWESEVKITAEGWIAEIKIPYSAIRFPKEPIQKWAFQLNRYVRRTRELTQWSKTPSQANNSKLYWGTLEGITDVDAPLRLSFTPYLSSYLENTPVINSDGNTSYSNSFSYNVGADVKYGIDERFTLDMTLFPDFGQVQSDNKIKNLSYREVTYDENRPFFKESVELFDKNSLFYSRRIGKIPSGFFSIEGELQEGESITDNPSKVKLLHALKLSGRTDDGMGIGLFNAITDNTYATIEDAKGNKRRVLTEPLTNFSVMVFDQQLKNNSRVYLINTNVTRDKKYSDSNVTGSGFSLSNKKNTFEVGAEGAVSQRFFKIDGEPTRNYNNIVGYKYTLFAKKVGGLFEYAAYRTTYDNNYYTSDLGFQAINNRTIYEFQIQHNVHKPWRKIRNSYNNIGYSYATHFITGKPVVNEYYSNFFITFLDYNSIFFGGGSTPGASYDYFEPRVDGRYNKSIKYYYAYAGLSTDYRKKLAVDVNLNISNFIGQFVSEGFNANLTVRYRVNDKLSFRAISFFNTDPYNLGFADIDAADNIIYGLRKVHTYENSLSVKYNFKNDMFITLNARHYWSTALYRKYLTLLPNGEYEPNYVYDGNNNFNYNAFNIDFIYSWQFSPGSNLSIAYKNAIEADEPGILKRPTYQKNLSEVLSDPQTNSISIKVLYYLDYLWIRKNLRMK